MLIVEYKTKTVNHVTVSYTNNYISKLIKLPLFYVRLHGIK